MNTADVIIIGAGAAGLMAARELALAGKKVVVLEAQDTIGGRIHTIYDQHGKHTELGAEFVHGDLPVTLGLLHEAHIAYQPASAAMWRYKNGRFTENEQFIEHWDLLMDKLNALQHDMSIEQFMQQEFADEQYAGMRKSVTQFVSGYDTADPEDASCFALRNEWQHEDEGAQHRLTHGYAELMNYLAKACTAKDGKIILNAIVKAIDWEQGKVTVTTNDGIAYEAKQAILALPLGVLQAGAGEQGAITFHPQVTQHQKAIMKMGFGAVIKLILAFDEAFWKDEQRTGVALDEMGYLFSEESIPTWWTQYPQHETTLTGWIGGPPARNLKDLTNEEILEKGLQSVANIFKFEPDALRPKLKSWHVVNWTSKPFTRGSYAYDTVEAPQARQIINTPINNTLFFTGEYLYEGTAMGTVEAALTSGKAVADSIKIA